jgi:hypothetical protein
MSTTGGSRSNPGAVKDDRNRLPPTLPDALTFGIEISAKFPIRENFTSVRLSQLQKFRGNMLSFLPVRSPQ